MTDHPRPISPSHWAPSTSDTTNNTHKEKKSNADSSPGLRRRLSRATIFSENLSNTSALRRNSTALSDSVSEARNSIRSSTDDIFFPRVSRRRSDAELQEESHWQSAPLGLALLPAIAGVFFQNGSAVVTDITLLVLAAIFLNWSVRLPWNWYRSAQQAVRQQDIDVQAQLESDDDDASEDTREKTFPDGAEKKQQQHQSSAIANQASKELQIYELAALASCFILPMVGTWLLHTIRFNLSRPSEGLVSNYNLTIFLLAAEIRPFSHMLRMVQARTLHLQRTVHIFLHDEDRIDTIKVNDLAKRLEELETHVAEAAASRFPSNNQPSTPPSPDKDQKEDAITATKNELIQQATAEIQKSIQPQLDALNRAVRRYEKRTAVTSFETDSRIRGLESQLRDTISLAVSATGHTKPTRRWQSVVSIVMDWVYAVMLMPVQLFLAVTRLPFRVVNRCLNYFRRFFGGAQSSPNSAASMKRNKSKAPLRNGIGVSASSSSSSSSPRRLEKQSGPTSDGNGLKTIREYS